MNYTTALTSMLNGNLSTLIYFVTNSCNQRCRMCYNHEALNKNIADELSIEEVRKICRKLKKLLLLQCSGGEPFLQKNFYEVLSEFAIISTAITIR